MTREEQLACLKDRPCDVCKMRTEHGCSSWECVFEQTPDEEKNICNRCQHQMAEIDRDYIKFPKGSLKKREKDYVVYNYAWLKKNWQTELKVMGIDVAKEIYNKGYKDGQEALAFHLELCKEEGNIITVPDGATNGEVFDKLMHEAYPKAFMIYGRNDDTETIAPIFSEEWWNSPYRKE